jgi:hypothetical protein
MWVPGGSLHGCVQPKREPATWLCTVGSDSVYLPQAGGRAGCEQSSLYHKLAAESFL